MSSHGAFVIIPGSDENTSPEAILSLTRTGCHLEAFSVNSNSSLREKNNGKEEKTVKAGTSKDSGKCQSSLLTREGANS